MKLINYTDPSMDIAAIYVTSDKSIELYIDLLELKYNIPSQITNRVKDIIESEFIDIEYALEEIKADDRAISIIPSENIIIIKDVDLSKNYCKIESLCLEYEKKVNKYLEAYKNYGERLFNYSVA